MYHFLVQTFFCHTSDKKDLDSYFNTIGSDNYLFDEMKEIKNDTFHIFYRCSICKDTRCNMTFGKIIKREHFYIWKFENRMGKILNFKFVKEDYEQLFNVFIKSKLNRCKVTLESIKSSNKNI